jgi:hypothetical protein
MSILNHWRYRSILNHMEGAMNLQRRSSRGGSLGDKIATLIAYGIILNTNKGKDTDGRRLAPLKPKYLRWKIRNGFNSAILYMTNQMMGFSQVKGIVVVSRDAMTMFYGIDPFAQAKAEYAHEGNKGRPKREFYGIDKETDKDIEAFCDHEIDALIMSLGARRR